ncbi:MAG: DNA mismatch repair protein MutT [Porphyromonadaceae bacterium CG2_30_38_12]|nr:MAG: DNA mismatch repair protein MutT [Porphyromonadaceae bacterium CG2_30_38_12]
MDFKQFYHYCPHCGSTAFAVSSIKSMKCTDCGFSYYHNASAAVAAFITDKAGRILVCVRAKDPVQGTLDLPGGFVDYDETAEEAIKRELHEELQAEVTEVEYLFSLPNNYLYSGLSIATLDIFFKCKVKNIDLLQAADDVRSFSFIPMEQLNPIDFGLNSIQKAIQKYTKTA